MPYFLYIKFRNYLFSQLISEIFHHKQNLHVAPTIKAYEYFYKLNNYHIIGFRTHNFSGDMH